jgi:hypothetical protein
MFKLYKILKNPPLSRAVLPQQFCFEKGQNFGILPFLAVITGIDIGEGRVRKCF